jgi:hypothetical protein
VGIGYPVQLFLNIKTQEQAANIFAGAVKQPIPYERTAPKVLTESTNGKAGLNGNGEPIEV